MNWERPITADGATATPEQLRAAWQRWSLESRKSATTLAVILQQVGVEGTAKFWPTARVADRMLQAARKAGVIRYAKGQWHFGDAP
jgi:hypothetical protein